MSKTLHTAKWNNDLNREVYWDASQPDVFKVPYYSVDYEDDPSHYTRVVIERDRKYMEPVTVAMDPSDSLRSKMFICNKRLSFIAGEDHTGSGVLKASDRSRRLLRNGVFWCLDLDKDQMLLLDNTITETPDSYSSDTRISPIDPLYDFSNLSKLSVSGNLSGVDSIIESLPGNGLTIPGNLLLTGATGDLYIENKEVPVYSREVSGNENLRVEFGEYSYIDYRNPSQSYTSPRFESSGTEGLIAAEDNIHVFWNALWSQSEKTGKYLADLLDTRESPVGRPRSGDIVRSINPLKFILAHILAAGMVFVIIKVKQKETESPEEALIITREEVDTIPWGHVNQLLPMGTNYIVLYTS